jgi:hypothetical protein
MAIIIDLSVHNESIMLAVATVFALLCIGGAVYSYPIMIYKEISIKYAKIYFFSFAH